MPKMKTHSGAKKRFKLSKKGRVKATHAFKRHLLTKKSQDTKRDLGKTFYLTSSDAAHIKQLLGR
jgi:large subunit ribosomal protein L35